MKKPLSEPLSVRGEEQCLTDRDYGLAVECSSIHYQNQGDESSSASSNEKFGIPTAKVEASASHEPATFMVAIRTVTETERSNISSDSEEAEEDTVLEPIVCLNLLPYSPTADVDANQLHMAPIHEPPTDEMDLVDYITCPHCRAEHKIIESVGVDGFLTDYVIESQLREQSSPKTNGNNSIQCDGCGESSEPVVACCLDCAEYLCDFCFKAHKKLKKFVGHNAKELAELDKETITLRKPHRKYVCPQHPVESVQLYCQSCDTVICNKCIVSCVHNGHTTSEIDIQTRKKVCEQLLALSSKVDVGLELQMKELVYVKKVENVTNDMAADVQQKINSAFDSYVATLGKRRKELLANSESKCNKKMKLLWSEKDSLERIVADMTTTQNFTKRIQTCEDNKEFLLLASQALPRLKKLEDWEWDNREIEDIERYTLSFQESDLDIDTLSTAGRLQEAKSLNIYKIEFQGFTDTAELGKEHSFMIHVTRGKSCHPWMSIETPEVTFKHVQSHTCNVADVCITKTDIECQKSASFESMDDEKKWEITNNWKITYTPYCGGKHRLTINTENVLEQKNITVYGTPEVGSAVIDGPNGDDDINGTVVSNLNYHSDTIDVQVHERYWGRNYSSTRTFSWGKRGKYEIQLQHVPQNLVFEDHEPCGSITVLQQIDQVFDTPY